MNERLIDFYRRQRGRWEEFNQACLSLERVETREVQVQGFKYLIQFNPDRRINIEAKGGENSCFLCLGNRPPKQEAMPLGDSLEVLCNPRPIFSYHFTIPSKNHEPQSISGRGNLLIEIAGDLGPGLAVFYNGPRCGASVPYHFHLQACPFDSLPIKDAPLVLEKRATLSLIRKAGRSYFYLEGEDKGEMSSLLIGLIKACGQVLGGGEEPMINIISAFDEGRWRVFLFPRRKHRPEVFYLSSGKRIAVSPGAVEMGGIVVTVYEDDFYRLGEEMLFTILEEVSVEPKALEEVLNILKSREKISKKILVDTMILF